NPRNNLQLDNSTLGPPFCKIIGPPAAATTARTPHSTSSSRAPFCNLTQSIFLQNAPQTKSRPIRHSAHYAARDRSWESSAEKETGAKDSCFARSACVNGSFVGFFARLAGRKRKPNC